jgi:formylglycine-generating enzyme required for sulfatase activity
MYWHFLLKTSLLKISVLPFIIGKDKVKNGDFNHVVGKRKGKQKKA